MQRILNKLWLFAAIAMLVACEDQQQAAKPQAMPPMPVNIKVMQPTSVPVSVEAVAQTEGAKEVEVRPRVGVFC